MAGVSSATAGIPGTSGRPGRSRVEDLVLLALGIAAAVLAVSAVAGRVAELTILLGALLLPGWLVVDRLGVSEPFARYLLSLLLGAAVEAAVCLGMVESTWWHPVALGTVLLIGCVTVLAARVLGDLPGSRRRLGGGGGGAGDVLEETTG